ncbi:unnamed protein product [Anisakis simplex]|uniref:Odorant response abnormal protein 4 (inferred by orthology to a C. elegans protein) n=1 Tax=Anisakis simplex TaxID=6269 RepID=A0A0M3K301_ANISI|nr:unnamed protein product [Anisakis simplex]
MIALDKCLETLLDAYVKQHCAQQRRIGLLGTAAYLIGSKLANTDDIHVAHIALCPLPETADDEAGDMQSRLIDAEWISEHGSRVVRLLPGGISIVGLLWLADKRLALPARTMLIEALASINKQSDALSSLALRTSDPKMALITVETPLGRPQGYIVDCTRKGAEGWQTKVAFTQVHIILNSELIIMIWAYMWNFKLDWISLESSASVNMTVPINDPTMLSNFKRQFVAAICEWTQDVVFSTFNNASKLKELLYLFTDIALVDGRLRHGDDPLRTGTNKKGRASNSPVRIETFASIGTRKDKDCYHGIAQYCSLCIVELSADINVRAAVPSKATVRQAVDAVKEHVIRSICSRAELHYESTDVVEDEQKDRLSVHQLPRIASTPLPSQPAIVFSDFLFEGDSKFDAHESFNDYLTLDVNEEEIEDDLERHLEDTDLAEIGRSEEGPRRAHRSSSSASSHRSTSSSSLNRSLNHFISSTNQPLFTKNYLILVSIFVALIAIVIYILINSLGE